MCIIPEENHQAITTSEKMPQLPQTHIPIESLVLFFNIRDSCPVNAPSFPRSAQ